MPAMVPWHPVHTPPALAPGTLHIWRLPQQVSPADRVLLDDHETARAGRMPVQAASEWQATRIGLRKILGAYTGQPAADLRFVPDAAGKPHLPAGPEFNLSHTRGMALLAVSLAPVGVDVEPLRAPRNAREIAARVFDTATQQQLACLDEDARADGFIRAWTAMEARQKCLGQGVFGQRVAPEQVGVHHVTPGAGYVACIAWQPPSVSPEFHWMTFPSCQ